MSPWARASRLLHGIRNQGLRGALLAGYAAGARGDRKANPYQDKKGTGGRVTWARAWRRAWADGWTLGSEERSERAALGLEPGSVAPMPEPKEQQQDA